MDTVIKEQRKKNIAHLKLKIPLLKKARICLYHRGFRYRFNVKDLSGKSDIVLENIK